MVSKFFNKVYFKLISFKWGSTIVNSDLGKRIFISKKGFISNTKINNYTSIGRNSTIINADLGKFCSISWNVTIGATQHRYDNLSTHAFSYIKRFGFVNSDKRIVTKTKVGNDVWIGANAIIMPGVVVGDGAVIGAGAIVTKDVDNYEIVYGIPAKSGGYRFNQEIISILNEIRWWEWSDSKIKKNINFFKDPLSKEMINKLKVEN